MYTCCWFFKSVFNVNFNVKYPIIFERWIKRLTTFTFSHGLFYSCIKSVQNNIGSIFLLQVFQRSHHIWKTFLFKKTSLNFFWKLNMQRKCYLLPTKNAHSTAFSYKYLATNSYNLTLSDCIYSPRGLDAYTLIKVILMKQNKKEINKQ